MKNVLSPSSETIITDNDAMKAWRKLASITGAEATVYTHNVTDRQFLETTFNSVN